MSSVAKFNALALVVAADTGAGGLRDTAQGAAFIFEFLHADDQQTNRGGSGFWAEFEEGAESNEQALIEAGSNVFNVSRDRIHVFANRDNDRDRSRLAAIVTRFWVLFNNVKLSQSSIYKFTAIRVRRTIRVPASAQYNHRVIEILWGATGGN